LLFSLQEWLHERDSILCLYVMLPVLFLFIMEQQHLVGQGLLIIEASLSHANTPQPVGLL